MHLARGNLIIRITYSNTVVELKFKFITFLIGTAIFDFLGTYIFLAYCVYNIYIDNHLITVFN